MVVVNKSGLYCETAISIVGHKNFVEALNCIIVITNIFAFYVMHIIT